jgi:hypothetical protein
MVHLIECKFRLLIQIVNKKNYKMYFINYTYKQNTLKLNIFLVQCLKWYVALMSLVLLLPYYVFLVVLLYSFFMCRFFGLYALSAFFILLSVDFLEVFWICDWYFPVSFILVCYFLVMWSVFTLRCIMYYVLYYGYSFILFLKLSKPQNKNALSVEAHKLDKYIPFSAEIKYGQECTMYDHAS